MSRASNISSPETASMQSGSTGIPKPSPFQASLTGGTTSPVDELFRPNLFGAEQSQCNSCSMSDPGTSLRSPGLGPSFTVRITTLLMGLKTLNITVRPNTTVLELKELIQNELEDCPPPERQRLTYNREELRHTEHASTTLSQLTPPAGEGSRFSMAVELKVEQELYEDVNVEFRHYHGYNHKMVCAKDETIGTMLKRLQATDGGEKWDEDVGKMLFDDEEVSEDTLVNKYVPAGSTNPCVMFQFFPLPNYNVAVAAQQDLQDQSEEQYNGVRLNGDPCTSPSAQGGLYFEVRLYAGSAHLQVLVSIAPSKTVAELKALVKDTFQAEHEKELNLEAMKLLCNAQMRGDDETVQGFNTGDRGTAEQPAIMHLHMRTDSSAYDMEVEEEDDGADEFPVLRETPARSFAAPCAMDRRRTLRVALAVFFVSLFLLMVLSVVGTALSKKHDTGYCHATPASQLYSYCKPAQGNLWSSRQAALRFDSSDRMRQQPCTDCFYTVAATRFDEFYGHDGAYTYCEKVSPASSLLYVSSFVPSSLCAKLQNNANGTDKLQYVWVDGRLAGDQWLTSTGSVLDITEDMWATGEPRAGKQYLALRASTCQLVTVSAADALEGWPAVGVVCTHRTSTVQLTQDMECTGAVLAAITSDTVQVAGLSCAAFCKKWCDATPRGEDTCCEAESHVQADLPSEESCTCSVKKGTQMVHASALSTYAAKAVPSPHDTNLHRVGREYFVSHVGKIAAPGDLANLGPGFSEQDCAVRCSETPRCVAAGWAPGAQGHCRLFTDAIARFGHTADKCCTMLKKMQNVAPSCDMVGEDVFHTQADCLVSTWKRLSAPAECANNHDGTCSVGEKEVWHPFSLALLLVAGGLAFISVIGAALTYRKKPRGPNP